MLSRAYNIPAIPGSSALIIGVEGSTRTSRNGEGEHTERVCFHGTNGCALDDQRALVLTD